MNYSNIKYYDIANGVGIRTSVFVSGCNLHCKGCFNKEAWDFNSGKPFDSETMNKVIDSLGNSHNAGLSILGGEPMDIKNQPGVYELIKRVREKYPDKSIWLWTGYEFVDFYKDRGAKVYGPQHTEFTDYIINNIQVLVTGPYREDLANYNLQFRGSSNQVINRLIDGFIVDQVEGFDNVTDLYK